MSLLSTFSTNSINILAGINGSETSQALIIALSVILNDLLYLPWPFGFRIPLHLLGGQAELEVGAELKTAPNALTSVVLKVFSTLGLVQLSVNPETRKRETTNLTILNVFLIKLGPMREDTLVKTLISTQVACSMFAFVIRYGLAWLLYDGNRR
ncbi:hypothetical protein EW026_g2931 [Hermanssonia centrifuga]|uniref:Uncharacterized protein n=1 Tax=Hermanssonia centrifuga TaxID=98765 RepID=A0A4V3XAT8_9APHY|nr:hypothetical protein EW026_g2931 [Hermanssonia centrifuga]